MTPERMQRIIREFMERRRAIIRGMSAAADRCAFALEAALYLEEEFGICLSDEEISPEILSSPESMMRLIARKLRENG